MRSQLITSLLLLAAPVFSSPTPGKDSDCDATVKSGQSIQKAIDNAKSGAKIVVEAGEYHEQLTITKNGIKLISKGAVLLPPKDGYKKNFCTGLTKTFDPPLGDGKDADAGICIYGPGFELAPYVRELQHSKIGKTGDYIRDVVIRGFEIRNFTGENIALIGGKNVKITENKLVDGAQYGFLTVGSQDTKAEKNTVTSSTLGFIAMCMDDKANAVFKENDVSNYYIALCTQTPGGLVTNNKVKNCCFGPFVDPGIQGVKVTGNTISTRNAFCPPDMGAGIAVLGSINALIERNTVEHYQFNNTGVGLFIGDDPATGTKATGNVFRKNVLKANDLDIYNTSNGTGNTFTDNQCDNSLPVGLCKK